MGLQTDYCNNTIPEQRALILAKIRESNPAYQPVCPGDALRETERMLDESEKWQRLDGYEETDVVQTMRLPQKTFIAQTGFA